MEKISLFKEGNNDKQGLFTQAGKGVIKVGTVVGAGILLGMGFSAFQGAANGE